MATSWVQPDGDLEVSLGREDRLAREDRPNRPTMITVADKSTGAEVVMQPHDARWLIERLEDVIAAAAEHD